MQAQDLVPFPVLSGNLFSQATRKDKRVSRALGSSVVG
jgi:hypothetical protein